MISLTIKKAPERILWIGLLFCSVCQSYRYPLQVSDAGTSPTYADTPVSLQLPKFGVMLALGLFSTFYIMGRRLPFRRWVLAVLVVCMSAYPLVKALAPGADDRVAHLQAAFWPVVALTLVLATSPVTAAAIDRFFRFLLIYAFLSNAIEIILFATVGRLPALAYPNSLLVRFGGFLDDPNAFAALLYMLIGWAYYRYSGVARFLVVGGLLASIFITQCLTALAFLVLLAIFFAIEVFVRRPRPLLFAGVTAFVGMVLDIVWTPLKELVSGVLETKTGSTADHLSQFSGMSHLSWVEFIYGGFSYRAFESWWVGSVVNYGIPWFLLALGLVLCLTVATFRAYKRASDKQSKAVLAGILLLSCYFLFGDLNLPYFKIFPVNFFFFFFCYMVYFRKIEPSDATASNSRWGRSSPSSSTRLESKIT